MFLSVTVLLVMSLCHNKESQRLNWQIMSKEDEVIYIFSTTWVKKSYMLKAFIWAQTIMTYHKMLAILHWINNPGK